MTAKRPREEGQEAGGATDLEAAMPATNGGDQDEGEHADAVAPQQSPAGAEKKRGAAQNKEADGAANGEDAEAGKAGNDGAAQEEAVPLKRQRTGLADELAGGEPGPSADKENDEDEDEVMVRRAFKRNDAVAARIKMLMVKVGQGALKAEAAKKLEGQLCMLAGALEKDVEHHGDVIVASLIECGCSFGWKAAVYGTLVGLLPSSVQISAARCTEKRLLRCLRGDMQFHAQGAVVLRLLCEMANAHVVAVAPLLEIMALLADGGAAWMVVRALPWLRVARKHEAPSGPASEDFTALVEANKSAIDAVIAKLDALAEDKVPGWQHARGLLEGEERADDGLILRPYELDGVRAILSHASAADAPAHLEFLSQSLAQALEEVAQSDPPLQLRLRLFDIAGAKVVAHQEKHLQDGVKLLDMEQEDPKSGLQMAREATVEGVTPQVNWVIRQYVEELLHAYYPHVSEAVEGILEFGDGRKYDYCMFESALDVLAQDTGNAIFMQRILVELCKLRLGSRRRKRFAVVAEDAVDAIMVLAPSLSSSSLDAFASWFAFHLSVGSPQWPFGKWDQLARLDKEGDEDAASGEGEENAEETSKGVEKKTMSAANRVRCGFLRRVLELHANLSLRDNLLETLSPAVRERFLVAERRPNSRFLPETGAPTLAGLGAAEIADFVRQKPEEDEFRQWFAAKAEKLTKEDQAECLLHGILLAGQPTFTHTARALERLLPVLKEVFAESELSGTALAGAARSFWKASSQWSSYVLYTLVRLKVIKALDVTMYCLSLVNDKANFGNEWVFSLLQGVLDASSSSAGDGSNEDVQSILAAIGEKRDSLVGTDSRDKERLDRLFIRNRAQT
ncbi:Nuclear cap-binding protein subunit 1 [Hondaea fermentalgiana]|uniref:Nuclear cap-binding protein subunit 1 n=1 Tax=Hondaea fermentalgiana TaxID=2315210 RepID=A0A2R5G8Z3_9STRA|nr:Nuclear cap-binding protein subunit 1 [Hondaea fermentalgiana]|eukprot:GBG24531.1 Nuclear cap-binding protein subunit 1 [Hondaea fermentalgiana]